MPRTSVLVGAKTTEQLVDNLGATDVTWTAEHLALLDAASALPREYSGWMLERQNAQKRGILPK